VLHERIDKDEIETKYGKIVLNISLPRKEDAKHAATKQIAVK